jgi:SH3 domain-containing protein
MAGDTCLEVRSPQLARRRLHRPGSFFAILTACSFAVPAWAQDPLAALGMQRAAASPLQWDVGDAAHPLLGPIRFAVLRKPVATAVGDNRVSSNVYVSCERNARRIAIELANSRAPDDPGGFGPKTMPRLTCNGVDPAIPGRASAETLRATWSVNEVGDALARGLWPSQLRQCASIGIEQEVRLPKGWSRETARIDFEITSYTRALDDVFHACGEPSVYADAAPATAAPPAAPATGVPQPPVAPSAAADERPWKKARLASKGETQLHAAPRADAEVVATLEPGTPVRVQFAGGNWWRVKPQSDVSLEGYIPRERITFR